MPKYLVETISMYRMRYVIECAEESHAKDEVTIGVEEFGQQYLGENIVSTREVSDGEIVSLFIEDHPYLEGQETRAFNYIHKISY